MSLSAFVNWYDAYFLNPVWEKRAKEVEAAEVLADQSQEQSHGPDPIPQGDSEYLNNG